MTYSKKQSTSNQQRRERYAVGIVQGLNDQAARKAAGIKDPRTSARIADRYHLTNSFADAKRSGRPRKFSDEKLAAAFKVLVTECNSMFTSASLAATCAELGIIDHGVQPQNFITRLREYIKKQGYKLCYHHRRRTFMITHSSAKQREAFATEMLQCLESKDVGCYCFPDETTIEKSPHPKGII